MGPSHCVCDLRVQAAGAEIQQSDTAWKPGHIKAEGKALPALRRPDCRCSQCLVGQEWDLFECICVCVQGQGWRWPGKHVRLSSAIPTEACDSPPLLC